MNDLKSILLVEDNPNDVELVLEALNEYHLANEVFVVTDGEEALAYLRREGKYKMRADMNPGVILLDLKLPKVDGLEVLREIKTKDTLKTIPVVILTSSREERDLIESYKLGTNAYIVKPVDFKEFVDAVKQTGVFWAILNERPPGSLKRA